MCSPVVRHRVPPVDAIQTWDWAGPCATQREARVLRDNPEVAGSNPARPTKPSSEPTSFRQRLRVREVGFVLVGRWEAWRGAMARWRNRFVAMSRRKKVLALIPVLILVLAACNGKTLPATNVMSSSAALNGQGSCGTNVDGSTGSANCTYYFQYGVGQYDNANKLDVKYGSRGAPDTSTAGTTPVRGAFGSTCGNGCTVQLNPETISKAATGADLWRERRTTINCAVRATTVRNTFRAMCASARTARPAPARRSRQQAPPRRRPSPGPR